MKYYSPILNSVKNSITILMKKTFSELKKKSFIEDYRFFVKNSIQSSVEMLSNFEMILTLSLFTFAFSQILWLNYKEQVFTFFTKNSLPGVCLPWQTLSWDTFNTVFSNNFKILDETKIELYDQNQLFRKHIQTTQQNNYFVYDSTKPQIESLFPSNVQKQGEFKKRFFFQKVDIYPNSILLSPTSQSFFCQKNVEIGVFPLKSSKVFPNRTNESPDFLFESEFINQQFLLENKKSFGPTWSSLSSYRLNANGFLFQDEFPSKLSSNRDLLMVIGTKQGEKVRNFTDLIKQPDVFVSTNAETSALKKTQTNVNLQKKVKIPFSSFDLTNQPLRAFSKFLGTTSDENLSNEKTSIEDLFDSEYRTKKAFLFHALQNLNEQENSLVPFFSLQNVSSTNKIQTNFLDTLNDLSETDVGEESLEILSDLLQSDVVDEMDVKTNSLEISGDLSETDLDDELSETDVDEESLEASSDLSETKLDLDDDLSETDVDEESLEASSNLVETDWEDFLIFSEEYTKNKPSSWIDSRLRSGFFYPDISHEKVTCLPLQIFSKKNPIINFFRNVSVSGKQQSSLPINLGTNQVFFRPQLLPLEVRFHANLTHYNSLDTTKSFSSPDSQSNNEKVYLQLKIRKFLKKIRIIDEIDIQVDDSKTTSSNETAKKIEDKKVEVYEAEEGPLLIEKSTGYDIKLRNKTSVQKWFKNFISTRNPLTDRKINFFGYQENHFQTQSNIEKIKKSLRLPNKAVRDVEEDLEFEVFDVKWFPELPVIISTETTEIPFLKEDEWSSILQKSVEVGTKQPLKASNSLRETEGDQLDNVSRTETEVEEKKKNFRLQLIPAIRIAFPQVFARPLTFFESNPMNFQDVFLEQVKQSEFVFHTLPWSRSHDNNVIRSKYHSGDFYKREIPVFKEKAFKNFYPSSFYFSRFEPCTSSSWLIISHISLLLFGLKICHYFFLEYYVVILFIVDLLVAAGILTKEFRKSIELEDTDKKFRVLKGVNTSFQDVAGIHSILPELTEIIWFFKNAGRSSKIGKSIPKGILFVGPPGTGKTFLAKVIAGESKVPILLQSGSTLSTRENKKKGTQQLKDLFQKARELAPCILFIDEIDTIGGKRENHVQNPMGSNNVLKALNFSTNGVDSDFDFMSSRKNFEITPKLPSKINQSVESESKHTQLNILTQFLVEMDGLDARRGVLVLGATNRPDVLDPAFVRPGRFDQIIPLEFPTKQKRIEIFQLYSKNLGFEPNISWSYLANRTKGLSAAYLSAAMNESSIQAILKDTTHTTETIEQGLNFIQNSTRTQLSFIGTEDPFYLKRLAFSQAGKALLCTLLPHHPPCVFINLWTPTISQNKFRSFQKNRMNFDDFSTRYALENILVGLYAGKASELLVLFKNATSFQKFNRKFEKNKKVLWESDLQRENMTEATLLSQFMITKWYFYSKKLSHQKWNLTITQQNEEDFKQKDALSLFENLTNQAEFLPQYKERAKKDCQKISLRAWWQKNVTEQISLIDSSFGNWYRLYLTDPHENSRNEEWIPADENYHNTSRSFNLFKNFLFKGWINKIPGPPVSVKEARSFLQMDEQGNKKSSLYWNDLYKMNRDYLYHGLVLSSFNKAFSLLDENREILDYFADYLLRYEILREYEIAQIFLQFQSKFADVKTKNIE